MSKEPAKLTRLEYENIEGIAIAAMIGLLSRGHAEHREQVAVIAFNQAEAMIAEQKKRYGEKPEGYA